MGFICFYVGKSNFSGFPSKFCLFSSQGDGMVDESYSAAWSDSDDR